MSREAKTPAENDRGSCASLAAQCLIRPRLTRPRLANDKAAIILGLLPQKAVPTWNPDAEIPAPPETPTSREGTGSSNPLPSSRQSGSRQTRPLQAEKAAVPRGWAPLRSAETRSTGRNGAHRRCYLCRAIFQYRSAADVIGQPRPQPR